MINNVTEDIAKGKILTKRLVLLMSITCGLAVANLYYNQPLLADMGRTFHASSHQVGNISMFTQIGYAIGMFLFVPLGDMRERRRLITILLAAVTISLVGVAAAQTLLWIYVASLAVGITTVVPQVIIPLAAQMAEPEERGKVIGSVMSGLLFGILLARTVAGFIGGSFGWRMMYWVAAVLMLALALILKHFLPKSYPEANLTYRQVLKSIGELIVTQPTLREASLVGALLFGSFSVFWTSLAFYLEGAPFNFGSEVTGLFGLVGVVGAGAAPLVGRLADRFSPKSLVGMFIIITLLSYLFFGFLGSAVWGIIVGVILLDLGVQGAQISNQTRIYSLVPEARSRLNTVFMVTYFLGGSLGSSLGSYAWNLWQWQGVCLTGGMMIVLGFFVWGIHQLKYKS
ncbi:MFS transporter [Neobacillus drentensis]|uniref:MFS transporter n=1 Tax=Neobacillus drentensis TaxID=220684 RepID=UPI001F1EFBEE|nr:MFS transporter [Neobacillus drentensis]ULT58265.1 MFS transporter [Neobacillus drentensis]